MLARALSRRSSLVTTNGLRLTVAPGVFHPTLYATTLVFAEYLHSLDLDGKRVLEMGTGSGMLAMEAARRGAQVVAADINPAAVSCARENAARNGLATRVTVIESDLFASLASDQRFDIILWNVPFYPRNATDDRGRAWFAGREYEAIRRFATGAGRFLAEGGAVLVLVSLVMELEKILPSFEATFAPPRVVAIRRGVLETFAILSFEANRTRTGESGRRAAQVRLPP